MTGFSFDHEKDGRRRRTRLDIGPAALRFLLLMAVLVLSAVGLLPPFDLMTLVGFGR